MESLAAVSLGLLRADIRCIPELRLQRQNSGHATPLRSDDLRISWFCHHVTFNGVASSMRLRCGRHADSFRLLATFRSGSWAAVKYWTKMLPQYRAKSPDSCFPSWLPPDVGGPIGSRRTLRTTLLEDAYVVSRANCLDAAAPRLALRSPCAVVPRTALSFYSCSPSRQMLANEALSTSSLSQLGLASWAHSSSWLKDLEL